LTGCRLFLSIECPLHASPSRIGGREKWGIRVFFFVKFLEDKTAKARGMISNMADFPRQLPAFQKPLRDWFPEGQANST